MSYVLSNDLEAVIDNKVREGLYSTSEDVLRAAFRLLEERELENRLTDEGWESDGIGEGFMEPESHFSMEP